MDSSGDMGSPGVGLPAYEKQQQSSQIGAVQQLGAGSLDPNSNYASALAQLTGTPNTGQPTASPNTTSASNVSSIQALMSQIMSMLGTSSSGG